MSFNEDIARHLIRERVAARAAAPRARHPRTARLMRRAADRLDGNR